MYRLYAEACLGTGKSVLTFLEWRRALWWAVVWHSALPLQLLVLFVSLPACFYGLRLSLHFVCRGPPGSLQQGRLALEYRNSRDRVEVFYSTAFGALKRWRCRARARRRRRSWRPCARQTRRGGC